jgi:hypothetical protein
VSLFFVYHGSIILKLQDFLAIAVVDCKMCYNISRINNEVNPMALIKKSEYAHKLGVSRSYVSKLVKQGRIALCEDFTYSEKMDYTRLISEIESAKARERMLAGISFNKNNPKEIFPEGTSKCSDFLPISGKQKPQTRDVIGAKIGMSGKLYDKAKYIAKHASQGIIDELDRKERTISGTYNELRNVEKKSQLPEETKSETFAPSKQKSISAKSYGELQEKLATTEAEFKEFVSKYAMANHKRGMLENQLQHVNFQLENERIGSDKIISELREQIVELKKALAVANERIRELEKIIEQKETEK